MFLKVSLNIHNVNPLHVLPGHFAGEDVKTKLAELHGRWDTLKSKASQRRQDLEDSLQAQQYFADANEAESWMREKEPIVGSTDYGKDEDSAEVHKPYKWKKFAKTTWEKKYQGLFRQGHLKIYNINW